MKGYSFCIITDGREPEKTLEEIKSIRALNLQDFEVILVGNSQAIIKAADESMVYWMGTSKNFRHRDQIDMSEAGRLGAMRNLAGWMAKFDITILADDDILFDHDFGWGLEHREFGNDWDVMAVRIQNPDGSRYWDWKTHRNGHDRLLDYGVKWHPDISLTGGIMVLKKHVLEMVRWNDEKGFYQGEDVEFTDILKMAGLRIKLNLHCLVTHMADYTQSGDVVVRK